jgi:hypothetical protein
MGRQWPHFLFSFEHLLIPSIHEGLRLPVAKAFPDVREIAAANVHLIVDRLRHDRISRDAPGVRLCFLVSLKQESRTARFSRIDTGGAVSP